MTWTPAKVKALRKQAGLTTTAFAAALGVVESTVIRWEKGGVVVSALGAKALDSFARTQGERGASNNP